MWHFLLANASLPFLSAAANSSSNNGCMLFFACLVKTWQCNSEPVMSGLVALHLHFCPHLFANSPALLTGSHKLVSSSGLDYATTTFAMPNHISCWHFLSSLDTHSDGYLPHDSLTSPQLAQVLINYWACFEQNFASSHDYTWILPTHAFLITWQSMYPGILVLAIHHLLLPKIIAVWNEHRQGASDQG